MTITYKAIEFTAADRTVINIKATFSEEPYRILMIPTDPANSDYQRYLRWLENPNADETPSTLS